MISISIYLHHGQDWEPISSTHWGSTDETLAHGDSQEQDGQPDPLVEEVHYELNQLMETLETNLPENAIPGPDQPQVLAKSPKAKEDLGDSLPAASQPIATPCRSHVGCPSVGTWGTLSQRTNQRWFHPKLLRIDWGPPSSIFIHDSPFQ